MERFADIEILRYELTGFEKLNLREKRLVYCLSQATLWGRDITFDQYGAYNLKIRQLLECIYKYTLYYILRYTLGYGSCYSRCLCSLKKEIAFP